MNQINSANRQSLKSIINSSRGVKVSNKEIVSNVKVTSDLKRKQNIHNSKGNNAYNNNIYNSNNYNNMISGERIYSKNNTEDNNNNRDIQLGDGKKGIAGNINNSRNNNPQKKEIPNSMAFSHRSKEKHMSKKHNNNKKKVENNEEYVYHLPRNRLGGNNIYNNNYNIMNMNNNIFNNISNTNPNKNSSQNNIEIYENNNNNNINDSNKDNIININNNEPYFSRGLRKNHSVGKQKIIKNTNIINNLNKNYNNSYKSSNNDNYYNNYSNINNFNYSNYKHSENGSYSKEKQISLPYDDDSVSSYKINNIGNIRNKYNYTYNKNSKIDNKELTHSLIYKNNELKHTIKILVYFINTLKSKLTNKVINEDMKNQDLMIKLKNENDFLLKENGNLKTKLLQTIQYIKKYEEEQREKSKNLCKIVSELMKENEFLRKSNCVTDFLIKENYLEKFEKDIEIQKLYKDKIQKEQEVNMLKQQLDDTNKIMKNNNNNSSNKKNDENNNNNLDDNSNNSKTKNNDDNPFNIKKNDNSETSSSTTIINLGTVKPSHKRQRTHFNLSESNNSSNMKKISLESSENNSISEN